MKARLARPRGQLSIQGFQSFTEPTYDAYMGTTDASPDTIHHIRFTSGEAKFIANFTIDQEGKVFQIGIQRAP